MTVLFATVNGMEKENQEHQDYDGNMYWVAIWKSEMFVDTYGAMAKRSGIKIR
jgi:hypothetical protein